MSRTLGVIVVVLLISGCSSARNDETATPIALATATPAIETQVAQTDTPYPTHTPQPTATQTPTTSLPPALEATPTSTDAPTDAVGPISTPTSTPVSGDKPTSIPIPPTPTPDPVVYIVRAGDSLSAVARAYGVTVTAIAQANSIQEKNVIHVGQELTIPHPARLPTGPIAQPRPPVGIGGQTAVTLEQLPDTDPGPPITIQVSAVRIKPNGNYQVTGRVRNGSADVYGGISVIATFFTEPECGERKVQGGERKDKGQSGGGGTEYACDPNWHGPVEVYAACSLLAPGETCPFSLDIYPRDYVSYHLHPEGAAVAYHIPASLTVSGLSVSNDGFGYVHIRGTAINDNPFAIRDAYVWGTLIDAGGQIASVGTTLAPGEIGPGASVVFDVRVEQAPYVRYEVQAQATRN